jgi:hypothetical protein
VGNAKGQGPQGADSLINTSASNIIAGGAMIANPASSSANAYNMSFLSNNNQVDFMGGHPPSRGIGTRKMMAAVASGVIEEASPHSSKHDLISANNTNAGGGAGLYRKRF